MLQFERSELVLKHLSENERLSVRDAIRLFDASPATVRRDFNKLAREGLVRRFRGGVALVKTNGEIPPFSLRAVQHATEKLALAARAAQLLEPDDVVMIEGGTSTCMLGSCIPDFHLRIVTNSIRLASMLESTHEDHPHLETYLTGGALYRKRAFYWALRRRQR